MRVAPGGHGPHPRSVPALPSSLEAALSLWSSEPGPNAACGDTAGAEGDRGPLEFGRGPRACEVTRQ